MVFEKNKCINTRGYEFFKIYVFCNKITCKLKLAILKIDIFEIVRFIKYIYIYSPSQLFTIQQRLL